MRARREDLSSNQLSAAASNLSEIGGIYMPQLGAWCTELLPEISDEEEVGAGVQIVTNDFLIWPQSSTQVSRPRSGFGYGLERVAGVRREHVGGCAGERVHACCSATPAGGADNRREDLVDVVGVRYVSTPAFCVASGCVMVGLPRCILRRSWSEIRWGRVLQEG